MITLQAKSYKTVMIPLYNNCDIIKKRLIVYQTFIKHCFLMGGLLYVY